MATKRKIICEQEEQKMEKKKRRRAELEFDRLGNLPESLQLHILSFLDTKQAVQTSVLSRSWRSLWTSMSVLHLDNYAYRKPSAFDMFVNKVLSSRDQSAKLNRLTLRYRGNCTKIWNTVVDYAFSHFVQHLEVSIFDNPSRTLPIGSSDSLTSLKLESGRDVRYPNLWGSFKNLTVLHLTRAIIPISEPFSGFPMLEKLTLHNCDLQTSDGQPLLVHAPKLSDLTISGWWFDLDRCELATPNLRFLKCKGIGFPLFRTHDGFPVLETVFIDFSFSRHGSPVLAFDCLISLFQDFHKAKSLTLSADVVYFLSLFPKKLKNLNSPFCNLKCLRFDVMLNKCWSEIPSDVKAYLLHNSPKEKFTIIQD